MLMLKLQQTESWESKWRIKTTLGQFLSSFSSSTVLLMMPQPPCLICCKTTSTQKCKSANLKPILIHISRMPSQTRTTTQFQLNSRRNTPFLSKLKTRVLMTTTVTSRRVRKRLIDQGFEFINNNYATHSYLKIERLLDHPTTTEPQVANSIKCVPKPMCWKQRPRNSDAASA